MAGDLVTATFDYDNGRQVSVYVPPEWPDAIVFGSPGAGYWPPDVMPTPLPRTYLVAGTLEPFFLENATRWAAALRDAAGNVLIRERVAGHDHAMWREEFPSMVVWAFGRRGER